MRLTRRDAGKLVLAAMPLSRAFGAINSKIHGVQIGAVSYCFRGLPATEIIPDMVKIGLGEIEIMSSDVESLAGAPAVNLGFGRGAGRGQGAANPPAGAPSPAGTPAAAPGAGQRGPAARPPLTPEQQAAMQAARQKLTEWRAAATPDTFKGVRKQFNDAGIDVHLLCYNMGANITDDEIDYAFRMAQALGVRGITSSSRVAVAKRVAPFADKYKLMWAGHGHDNVNDPEEFAKPETFAEIMSFSKYIGVNLDIGHFSAAGYDPVAYIRENHARISNLHLKDRKRNVDGGRGANVPWGTGETPIKAVLQLMKKEKYPFPANIELEYRIPEGSDVVVEMTKCYEFCKQALA